MMEEFIGLRIVVAILDGYLIVGLDGLDQVVKTAVADQGDGACHFESKIIDVMLVGDCQLYLQVGIVYVSAFHVDKKLLAQVIFKLLNSLRYGFQRKAEF